MNPLWSNFFRKKADEDSLAFFLGTVPIFSELTDRELAFIEEMIHLRRYNPQETVFDEGDPGSGMYIILSGRVKIFHRYPNGDEEVLANLGPGDFFGETTLTAPIARTATVKTLDNTELAGLFRADLLESSSKHPGITNKVLLGLTRVISERLQVAAQEIKRLKAPELFRDQDKGIQ